MNNITIKTRWHDAGYYSAIVEDSETGDELAEYRLTIGKESKEVRDIRRAVNSHLDDGGTLGNYQW